MRILINASVCGHVVNGCLVYCREMLKELVPLLKRNGHDVVLLIPRGSILDEIDVKKKYLPAICGTPKKRSPINPICRLLYNFFVLPFLVRRNDIVYAMTPHCSFFGWGRQILTVLDLIPLDFPEQHRLQYYYARFFLPLVLRHSKKVICISNTTKQAMAEKLKADTSNATVVYCGCSSEFCRLPDASSVIAAKYGVSEYILACGMGFPHKNIRFLIESYAKLPEELQKKHPLVVVGINTDPYAQSLMALAASLPCSESIHFVGMVPQSDMPRMYAAARLFVYPTICEGFGMPPIESIRCGTPCIVSNLPILKETLSMADELYFDPFDHNDLAGKIAAELVREKTVAEDLVRRADSYSWQRAAVMALKVLEEVQ